MLANTLRLLTSNKKKEGEVRSTSIIGEAFRAYHAILYNLPDNSDNGSPEYEKK